jgi:hypothetical protein
MQGIKVTKQLTLVFHGKAGILQGPPRLEAGKHFSENRKVRRCICNLRARACMPEAQSWLSVNYSMVGNLYVHSTGTLHETWADATSSYCESIVASTLLSSCSSRYCCNSQRGYANGVGLEAVSTRLTCTTHLGGNFQLSRPTTSRIPD